MSYNFEALLEESVRIHGHLCPGQVLGVRMSVLGLNSVGIDDPRGTERKDFLVYVEIDRCATDAIQSVTGATLGKRTLKFMDYGKMAATFVNLKTGCAVRVLAREDARFKSVEYFPNETDIHKAQLQAYMIMKDEELFDSMDVSVTIAPEDMPGRPLKRLECSQCGEFVQDLRHIEKDGKPLCKTCFNNNAYYVKKVI
ncbi:FmdE family protein [Candidatus Magnetomonas plexicatena]|uniref:FmdE family protein n=1 Tax=Candidatus Magnetomonas plexicatena TaxID=2552947 RepID=UPI00110287D4|nr:formylmethanofuran dehydrogenase [Nitrospirales bacterium LBB_01]